MSTIGLQRSKCFLGITRKDFPQIVFPILDLIEKDPKWSKFKLTMHLLLLLSSALEDNFTLKSQFHPCFTQNQDIVRGLQDYYSWRNLTLQEFTKNEDLLLQILSNYLQRKIICHPLLKPANVSQNVKTFGGNFEAVFHILGYRFGANSFYISATNK